MCYCRHIAVILSGVPKIPNTFFDVAVITISASKDAFCEFDQKTIFNDEISRVLMAILKEIEPLSFI